MNKSILIHYNNTPNNVNNQFYTDNIIDFDYSNRDETIKSLNEYISKVIINKLKNKEIKIIYIKDNLSSNYLELYGLRVAYHIRLSQELSNIRFVPIVILSDVDGYTLNKLEPMAKILFTKNIFLEPNDSNTIKKFSKKTINILSKNEYKTKFLDLIEVPPPENSNNHSIANEWAIFKWAKELNISNSDDINNTISNISYQLYFKYLYQKNEIKEEIKEIEEKQIIKQSQKGLRLVKTKEVKEKKILLIDDELDKGWGDIFANYFKNKRGYTLPEIIPIEFKNKNYDDIELAILDYIEETKPDIILLDMRLVKSDHGEENPKNISGIKLLNKIKDTSLETNLNPGIQVIMLSATTRSDILEQAYKDNKILGYIQKDHIENTFLSTKVNVKKLSDLLIDAEKEFYMKRIWSIQKEISNFNIMKKPSNEYMISIKLQVESSFNLLDSNLEKKINLVVLSFYNIIEFLIKYYGGTHGTGFSQIRDICNNKLGICTLDTSLSEIMCTRNYIAHGEDAKEIKPYCQENTIKTPNSKHIVKWFEALKEIFVQIEQNDN